MNWRCSPSGRAQSPELKPQSHPEKKKKRLGAQVMSALDLGVSSGRAERSGGSQDQVGRKFSTRRQVLEPGREQNTPWLPD
jgi:hypothetical protein